MNRALIIPAVLAGGLHAALLFGFRGSPPPVLPPAIPSDEVVWQRIVLPPDEIDPPVVEAPDEPAQPAKRPAPGGPSSPETFRPIVSDGIIMEVAIAPYVSPGRHDVRVIPAVPGPGGIGKATRIIGLDELDNHPRALMRTPPRPPPGFAASATVTVEFVVGRDGRVSHVEIVDSTHDILDDACLREVRRWRFEPGMRQGVPVAFRVVQTFMFNPQD